MFLALDSLVDSVHHTRGKLHDRNEAKSQEQPQLATNIGQESSKVVRKVSHLSTGAEGLQIDAHREDAVLRCLSWMGVSSGVVIEQVRVASAKVEVQGAAGREALARGTYGLLVHDTAQVHHGAVVQMLEMVVVSGEGLHQDAAAGHCYLSVVAVHPAAGVRVVELSVEEVEVAGISIGAAVRSGFVRHSKWYHSDEGASLNRYSDAMVVGSGWICLVVDCNFYPSSVVSGGHVLALVQADGQSQTHPGSSPI